MPAPREPRNFPEFYHELAEHLLYARPARIEFCVRFKRAVHVRHRFYMFRKVLHRAGAIELATALDEYVVYILREGGEKITQPKGVPADLECRLCLLRTDAVPDDEGLRKQLKSQVVTPPDVSPEKEGSVLDLLIPDRGEEEE